jgi:hypothetical protein
MRFLILFATLPGCAGLGILAGDSEQHRKDDIAQAWHDWALGCGWDTGADSWPEIGACGSRDLGRLEDYVDCLDREGCDAQGACADEAGLAELDPDWCTFDG